MYSLTLIKHSLPVEEETALEWLERIDTQLAYLQARHTYFNQLRLIRIGEITEIVGENATGKMQLAMTIIAELLSSEMRNNSTIYIIDFNIFRVERLAQILSSRSPELPANELLNQIKCICARDSIQFEERLEELEKCLLDNNHIPLIFINKIGTILFDAVSEENKQGHIQKRILDSLNKICKKYGATIITTNHLVDWRGYPTPSLGKFWIKGISRRIILAKEQNNYYATPTVNVDENISNSEKIHYKLSEKGFDVIMTNSNKN